MMVPRLHGLGNLPDILDGSNTLLDGLVGGVSLGIGRDRLHDSRATQHGSNSLSLKPRHTLGQACNGSPQGHSSTSALPLSWDAKASVKATSQFLSLELRSA